MKRTSKTTLTIALLLSCAVFAIEPPLCVEAQTSEQGQPVELSKSLPPLNSTFAPGNTFDFQTARNLVERSAKQNYFYQVPSWVGGTWNGKDAVRMFSRNEVTGQVDSREHRYPSSVSETIGYIKDSQGNLWQYADAGYWTKTQFGKRVDYSYIRLVEPLEVTQQTLIFRALIIQIKVEPSSNKIVDTYQKETIVHCKETNPGVMRQKHLQRMFNWKGEPTLSTTDISIRKKVSEFEPVAQTAQGDDISTLFTAFMKSQGYE